ncbi:reverse transcriptase-like protein [Clostridium botulinum C]|uniref:Reverse transcriptase-like protein n=2 Tax=Clostridium botulinum TaxID=1491 RepID=A0A9Q4Y225_CLOBO|nr:MULTISPECIES: ribonuclease H family protein [Clostridium]KEI06450.1 ribonuclease HI [Clostridium sp. K25]MCD3193745.1 reverse transcriptase-like protein [Clostridium botulinum C]MCD3199813.1 reverse transcriptase-like protein [Clostridium botulinum C]MCD3205288.1 reverse transcriptase-like protein [Clostridium botulinum C]MCD3207214.1 reverse transcriptase-like protein [Clostridium botulinum C]
MAKKVYAIKEGFDNEKNILVKDKIVDSWSECLKYVKGVKGAKYKSFASIKEAEEYLSDGENLLKKEIDEYPQNIPNFYVDGSYNSNSGKYSYGLVMVEDGVVKYIENGAAENNTGKDVRQIAGELKAAIRSLQYAVENNIKDIVLIHDYVGVCYHATGVWQRREESSKKYYNDFNSIIKENDIKVTFVKVDSHTGDLYNEMVDEFAKAAAGVTIKGETKKYLKDKKLLVKSIELKKKFLEILGNNCMENIIIDEKSPKNKSNKEDYIKTFIEFIKNDKEKAKEYILSLDNIKKNNLINYLIDNCKL